MPTFLKDDGPSILSNGYKICFLPGGKKYPIDKGWQKNADASLDEQKAELNRHLTNGRANNGIGILTKYTPFADADFKNKDALRAARDWIIEHVGFAPCRVGNSPKRGWLFRLEGKPFKKLATPVFIDPEGNKAQLEILADGQQFASNHIHPDIRKPYRWLDGANPVTVPADELPTVTEELMKKFVAFMTGWMKKQGWKLESGQEDGVPGFVDESFADDSDGEDLSPDQTDPLGLSEEQMRKYVFMIPNSGEASVPYQVNGKLCWFAMMGGINHEDSSEVGKQIALEWSQQSHKHEEEPGRFEKTWNSFNNGTERRLVTFRAIIKWAKEADKRPLIQTEAGEIDRVATEAEAALISGGSPIYRRGPTLVRPVSEKVEADKGKITTVARLHRMTASGLVDYMARYAKFDRFDARANKRVRIDPPEKAAMILLSREGDWNFKPISGVLTAPTMRPDGSLILKPGYDPATRLLIIDPPAVEIPDKPSKDFAVKCIKFLEETLSGFKFVGPENLAVALSAAFTGVLIGAIPVRPLHAATAPEPGSGKSYLWDWVSAIMIGDYCPVTSASDPEENKKALSTIMMKGDPLINIDNVDIGSLRGDFINQAITQRRVKVRILGLSENVEIESRTLLLTTGNNLPIEGDLIRRTIIAALDAQEERPETRQFAFDPVKRVFENRAKFLRAILSASRWYVQAGFPGELKPLAGFGDWSTFVRSMLVALGHADPIVTQEKSRAADPRLNAFRAFMRAFRDEIGTGFESRVTAAQIIAKANEPDFNDEGVTRESDLTAALAQIAAVGQQNRNGLDALKLGHWLRRNRDRVVEGLKLVGEEDPHRKIIVWYVLTTNNPPPGAEL